MAFRLFARRTLWLPTLWGWALLFLLGALPVGSWLWWGERFLCLNEPVPPDVLVVEAWIGAGGIEEAAKVYHEGGYRWVVATAVNEPYGVGFGDHDFAAYSTRRLIEHGVPRDRILRLSIPRIPRDRTRTALAAVRPALQEKGIQPSSLTVFTVGVHARRSHRVLASLNPDVPVGALSWLRVDRDKKHWWASTERSRDFMGESVVYFIELVRDLWPGRAGGE